MRRLLLILALIPAVAAAEARSSDLDKAARLVFDQKYEAAARALETAWRQTGNKRDAVLRILELQGVVYAQLGQEAKARAAFQQLLTLDPKRELGGKYNTRVLKPFGEAQAWAADNPPLEATAEPAAVDANGKVLQIAVKVKNDALKLARRARFNIRPEGGKWSEQEVEIQGGYGSAGTDSDGVEWWAELLGDRDMVLAQVGSQRVTVREGKLREREPEKKEPVVAEKKDTPVVEKKAAVTPEREPEREPEVVVKESGGGSGGGVRAVGYTALAIGMASLIGGTVMGGLARANSDALATKRSTARFDAAGNVVSYEGVPSAPQQYDVGMRNRIALQATLANTLWGVGGGLVIAGIVLYLVGRDSADISAGSGGFVVSW